MSLSEQEQEYINKIGERIEDRLNEKSIVEKLSQIALSNDPIPTELYKTYDVMPTEQVSLWDLPA